MSTSQDTPTHWLDRPVVLFAIALPTVVTFVYFVLLANASAAAQQTAYAIGKTIQFGLPVVFIWLLHRWRFRRPSTEQTTALGNDRVAPPASQWGIGIAFGLLVVAAMFVAWFAFLRGSEIGDSLAAAVGAKVRGMQLDTPLKFLALGLFYAIFHSFLEEYYWRWFVFERLTTMTSTTKANLISSIGFAAHHVILLATFFGWSSPLTWLCSLGVAVGGVVWAWLYDRGGRLSVPWLSHLIVDAGIFALGYWIVFAK